MKNRILLSAVSAVFVSRTRPFSFCLCLLALIAGSTDAIAQRIHVVIAGDLLGHPDPSQRTESWRDCISADMAKIQTFFSSNVDPALLNIVRLASDSGANTPTKSDILNAINGLPVNTQDCIVFYYSGHGALSESKGHFLALPNQDRLYRSEIAAAMSHRKVRLNVVLTDTCSNIVPDPPREAIVQGVPYGSTPPPRIQTAAIVRQLFLLPRGTVDISGSAPDEYGTTMPGGVGSSFTVPLANYLTSNKDRDDIQWLNVVRDVTPQVANAWKSATKGQPAPNGQITQTVHAYGIAGLPRFGVRAQNLNGTGVIIREIQPDSPGRNFMSNGARSQLGIGDVIVSINGRAVRNEADYRLFVDLTRKPMRLTVRKASNQQLVTGNVTLRY